MTCTNPICEQFRIQHKNITLKRIELEKELQRYRKADTDEFNQRVSTNAVTQFRDAVTGDLGLMMPNGEVMTPEKIAKRIEIATTCMNSLQMSEKLNRQLVEENRILKQSQEQTHAEMRRLQHILSGFEKPRRFEFTADCHRETVKLNERLADQIEHMEIRLHTLEEENEALQQNQRRANATATRVAIDDEDRHLAEAYMTSDGRVPPSCPCAGCAHYEPHVLLASDPPAAFVKHMNKTHKVLPCLYPLYRS